ncbi:sphingosine N-acyltransferase lac1 [Colletotrichum tofieldiae]|uniref:Sphingosine N-acyltransferase lac1 n=1 Tax=Colletotrichum tofieldiae TaxID=708197 RepID=A0A161VUV6_9PEZI|nr:sphingosine N-acyltransferase lac1 [Colletotrichum tofieldiae]GKT63858.1 sphingosine N-acyltransferase lac1 [Colletotrichum tofieldiae]GKT72142.1 sphingosine N-acyltransferase lac1 [Colletotrichum tofieldiae]GKT90051.1 sphingosine N-acyltransferase lac1 [Colletotrichum tofieldiae]
MTAPESPMAQSSAVPTSTGKDQIATRRRRKSSVRGHGHTHDPSSRQSSKQDQLDMLSKRSRARAILRRCKHIAVKHTWTTPLVLILAFLSLYAVNPTESNVIHHFIFLSYKIPQQGLDAAAGAAADGDAPVQYGKGLWDIAFVCFYATVLSFTREFIMLELLRPLAKFYGIRSRGKQLRFMEQAYTAIYFGILGPFGLYVMSRTPVWYFNTTGMYESFPHKTHEAVVKFYYLFEAAYWAQQALVMLLGLEKPRKDYYELVAHHIVTLSLIGLSYRFHFTYMGIAVYLTHDISDFFMAMSKSLNYVDNPITGPWYCLSLASWIYLRHVINLKILWSILTEFSSVGPYELNWETQQYKCWISKVITFTLLGLLQSLNLFWLFFLVRIGYRFVFHDVKQDDRSEAEESEAEPMETIDEVSKVDVAPIMNGEAAQAVANGVAKAAGGSVASRTRSRRAA